MDKRYIRNLSNMYSLDANLLDICYKKLREMTLPGDQQYLFIGIHSSNYFILVKTIYFHIFSDLSTTSNLPDEMMIRSRIMPMNDGVIRPIYFIRKE